MIKLLKYYFWYLFEALTPLAAIFLLFSLWTHYSNAYGIIVLPSPIETIKELSSLINSNETFTNFKITTYRLSAGLIISFSFAIVLAALSKSFNTVVFIFKPNISVIMGVPPIAWMVLSLLWFGFGDQTVIFSVIIATLPALYSSVLIALNTLESKYSEVCRIYFIPWYKQLYLYFIPFLFSQILASMISAISIGWKIVIMAELFVASNGLGSELSVYRSQLQSSKLMAIVFLLVLALFVLEYGILGPIKREVEKWRC